MVQVYSDAQFPHHGQSTLSERTETMTTTTQEETKVMSREEHAQRMKELNRNRGLARAPRRGWSMTECEGDTNAPHPPHTTPTPEAGRHQASIPENAAVSHTSHAAPAAGRALPLGPSTGGGASKEVQIQLLTQLPTRPKIPPPRRSYSVMDYEPPPPNQPRPSSRLALVDLPSELHYALCDFLDPIDSVCLGLAHPKLYAIHRRKYGPVPLSSRYSGPNDREWVWRGAGPLLRSSAAGAAPKPKPKAEISALVSMRVQGQVYCRKCGTSRCELHRHLREWIGEGWEYCQVKDVFARPPGEDAKAYCFMTSPKNPHRCGRHGGKKLATKS